MTGSLWIAILLLPLILSIPGVLLWKIPPKSINSVYGFRIRLASRSIETWKYANVRSGKLMFISGGLLLVVNITLFLFFGRILEVSDTISFISRISTIIAVLIFTSIVLIIQHELKNRFDNRGMPIDKF